MSDTVGALFYAAGTGLCLIAMAWGFSYFVLAVLDGVTAWIRGRK